MNWGAAVRCFKQQRRLRSEATAAAAAAAAALVPPVDAQVRLDDALDGSDESEVSTEERQRQVLRLAAVSAHKATSTALAGHSARLASAVAAAAAAGGLGGGIIL